MFYIFETKMTKIQTILGQGTLVIQETNASPQKALPSLAARVAGSLGQRRSAVTGVRLISLRFFFLRNYTQAYDTTPQK